MANATVKNATTYESPIFINSPSDAMVIVGTGTGTASMPFRGASLKKTILYLTALNGTATYIFPIAYSQIPAVIVNSNAGGLIANMVTSLSTTSVTVTGSTTTGFLFLEGF